jgi:hypothetical protein
VDAVIDFVLYNILRISGLVEQVLVSEEGLRSMQLVISLLIM